MSCCLKSVVSRESTSIIDQCRFACGGHGFLMSSNLPCLNTTAAATVTYEGEYTVLLLQTGRLVRIFNFYFISIYFLEFIENVVFEFERSVFALSGKWRVSLTSLNDICNFIHILWTYKTFFIINSSISFIIKFYL